MGKFIRLKGRLFSLREKTVDNFTSLMEKTREGHIPPVIHVFPRGGLGSPRYRMMSLITIFL